MAGRVRTRTLAILTIVLLAIFLGSVITGLVLTRQPALEPVPVPSMGPS